MRHIGFLCVILFATPLAAQESLPRVLILGDSIYQQPVRDLAAEMKGEAELVFPSIGKGEVRHSRAVLDQLDHWLGESKWDLIHFNVGLGDLVYRAPKVSAFRILPRTAGGVRTTDLETYEANLRQLVERLQQTGAKLVWASTTPIRHSTTDVFVPGSERAYNQLAARVMAEYDIPINDMHEHVRQLIDMDRPAPHGWDPFHFDKQPIHAPIARHIRAALNR